MPRNPVTEEQITVGLAQLKNALYKRMMEHGDRNFVSRHEILGVIEEEMHELKEAIAHGTQFDLEDELTDVAVAALFGYICVHFDLTEW